MEDLPVDRCSSKEVFCCNGRFRLIRRLGSGSFGDTFVGIDTRTKQNVAVKLENRKSQFQQLHYESKVYRLLHQSPTNVVIGSGPIENGHDSQHCATTCDVSFAGDHHQLQRFVVIGVPRIFFYDVDGDYNVMAMELCGPSLGDLFSYCLNRFSLKTVLMIAEQMLHRIQFVHERGFLHRDIKPENFVFGVGMKSPVLQIIDFGLSKLYWDSRKNAHIPFSEGKSLIGTVRYCSPNVHRGYEQSRRDDVESIGYVLVYFLKGSLPWQGLQVRHQHLRSSQIGEKKLSTTLATLCKGLPSEFIQYFHYCRGLSFQQKPEYDYLRGLFRNVAKRYDYLMDASTPMQSPLAGTIKVDNAMLVNDAITPKIPKSIPNTDGKLPHAAAAPPKAAISHYRYDWVFDWFNKREQELAGGVQESVAHPCDHMESTIRPNGNPLHTFVANDFINAKSSLMAKGEDQGELSDDTRHKVITSSN